MDFKILPDMTNTAAVRQSFLKTVLTVLTKLKKAFLRKAEFSEKKKVLSTVIAKMNNFMNEMEFV